MADDLAGSYVRILDKETKLSNDLNSQLDLLKTLSDRLQSVGAWVGITVKESYFEVQTQDSRVPLRTRIPFDLLGQIATNKRALDDNSKERRDIENRMREKGLGALIK